MILKFCIPGGHPLGEKILTWFHPFGAVQVRCSEAKPGTDRVQASLLCSLNQTVNHSAGQGVGKEANGFMLYLARSLESSDLPSFR